MSRYRFLLRGRLAQSREWIRSRSPWRFELVLLACLLVGLTALICSRYLPSLSGLEEGSYSPRTVIAEKAVTVLDIEATENLKLRVAELVTPIYIPDAGALSTATEKLQTFLEIAGRLRADLAGESDRAAALSVLRYAAPETVSDATLEYLLAVPSTSADRIQSQTLGALETLYAAPITEDSLERVRSTLRSIADNVGGSEAAANAVYEIAAGYLGPNQVMDEERTELRRSAAMEQVAPVMVSVGDRETVVRKGEMVDAQDILILKALGLVGARSGWNVWLGVFFLLLLETIVFSRLVHRFNKAEPEFDNNIVLVLVVLLLSATAVARLLVIEPLSAYVIPVAALGMIVTVILNARTALLMVTLVSINIGLLTDLDMRSTLVALIVGSFALFLVSRVTKRATLLVVGLATMILAAFTIFAVEIFAEATVGQALRSSLWGLANGFLVGVLAIVLLTVLETLFNLTTPLRLLELADPGHPLLKKLMQVAPGTYNHSIQMGNLAEAAAEAIGANTLLARVGAYYHDIGKTVRPEYFVENQIYVENPHERLSPSLSKLAITAHVRDGEHLGKVYGLPQPVVDIIKQHHGTSVLAFFYHKAVQSAKDTVYEESYRYEEQKPQSKEASIIMLADSVEAAVRAMENPTRRKIQGVIQEVFKQKLDDGQLDESTLTQSDLHKIQDSFDISLLGLVGHRIRYPDPEPGFDRRTGRRGGAGRPVGPPSATGLASAVPESPGRPPQGGKRA